MYQTESIDLSLYPSLPFPSLPTAQSPTFAYVSCVTHQAIFASTFVHVSHLHTHLPLYVRLCPPRDSHAERTHARMRNLHATSHATATIKTRCAFRGMKAKPKNMGKKLLRQSARRRPLRLPRRGWPLLHQALHHPSPRKSHTLFRAYVQPHLSPSLGGISGLCRTKNFFSPVVVPHTSGTDDPAQQTQRRRVTHILTSPCFSTRRMLFNPTALRRTSHPRELWGKSAKAEP